MNAKFFTCLMVLFLISSVIFVSAQDVTFTQNGNQAGDFSSLSDEEQEMLASGFLSLILAFMMFFVILFIVVYVYSAFALMSIAKKTGTPDVWMAWVPIANVILMLRIAGVHWAYVFFLFIPFIAFHPILTVLSYLAVGAFVVWVWWKICEKRGFPGPLSLLFIVPFVNLVIMGVVAWGKGKHEENHSVVQQTVQQPVQHDALVTPGPNDAQLKQIRDYASAAIAKGKSVKDIKAELKKVGWSDDIIKKAL